MVLSMKNPRPTRDILVTRWSQRLSVSDTAEREGPVLPMLRIILPRAAIKLVHGATPGQSYVKAAHFATHGLNVRFHRPTRNPTATIRTAREGEVPPSSSKDR
eukprot:230302-Pyramimonas_sp.AAC.1